MTASKRLIQLGSRLRVMQVGSTMNTHMPPLRRTSVNSYRLMSSSPSGCGSESCKKQDQELELASLRPEYTKLQYEIGNLREKLELMVRDMSDETKKLISEAKRSAIKYSISATILVGSALAIYLCFPAAPTVSPHEAPPVDGVEELLFLASLLIVSLLVFTFVSVLFIEMTRDDDSKDQNGRKGRKG